MTNPNTALWGDLSEEQRKALNERDPRYEPKAPVVYVVIVAVGGQAWSHDFNTQSAAQAAMDFWNKVLGVTDHMIMIQDGP